jgi:hypothetical protein
MKPVDKRKDNFYIKDFSGSNERLKGKWIWTNNKDTLVLKFTPIYKMKYDERVFNYKNAYYDTNKINIKYIEKGNVLFDNLEEGSLENCLFANHLEILTTMFYLYNKCESGIFNHPVLMIVGNDLVLVNKWNEDMGVLIEGKEYKVKIPRTFTLKRL